MGGPELWDFSEKYFQMALDRADPETPIDVIRRDVESGAARIVPGQKSACLVYLVYSKMLHVRLAGGEMDDLRAIEPTVELMARREGCSAVTALGRSGWGRALRDIGWTSMAYKELRYG